MGVAAVIFRKYLLMQIMIFCGDFALDFFDIRSHNQPLSAGAGINISREDNTLDSVLCAKALEKVGDTDVLINIVSQRVRQLSSGSRPLLLNVENVGWADIALMELIEDKLTWKEADFQNTAPVYTANLRRKHRA